MARSSFLINAWKWSEFMFKLRTNICQRGKKNKLNSKETDFCLTSISLWLNHREIFSPLAWILKNVSIYVLENETLALENLKSVSVCVGVCVLFLWFVSYWRVFAYLSHRRIPNQSFFNHGCIIKLRPHASIHWAAYLHINEEGEGFDQD